MASYRCNRCGRYRDAAHFYHQAQDSMWAPAGRRHHRCKLCERARWRNRAEGKTVFQSGRDIEQLFDDQHGRCIRCTGKMNFDAEWFLWKIFPAVYRIVCSRECGRNCGFLTEKEMPRLDWSYLSADDHTGRIFHDHEAKYQDDIAILKDL